MFSYSWSIGGKDLIEAPILPCFVRAPTDNDAGGSGGTAHAARWLQLGLDRLVPTNASLRLTEHSSERIVIKVCLHGWSRALQRCLHKSMVCSD